MDFALSETQEMLRDSVRRWTETIYPASARRGIVNAGGFSADVWREMASLGWLSVAAPIESGGLDCAEDACVMAGELGRALVVEPFIPVAVLSARVLSLIGDEDRAQRLARGEYRPIVAHGEQAARGNPAFVATRARKARAGYELSGAKTLVWGGPLADEFLISARTGGAPTDDAGVCLFVVARDAPGLTRRDYTALDGSRACDIALNDTPVIEMLGPANAALPALERAHAEAIAALCCYTLGAMQQALDITCDYLRTRRQFGQPLSAFQALQHRAADMHVHLEMASAMTWRLMSHLADDDPIARRRAVSSAKVQLAEASHFVCGQAIQLHGGIGMTDEYVIGQYFKFATLADLLFGAAPFHLERLAETISLR